MSNPHLVGPVAPTSTRNAARSRRRPLPDDLLRSASRRLGALALVAGVLWAAATILGHVAVRSMSHGDPQWLRVGASDAIAAGSVLASVALFAYTRRSRRDPRQILDIGLGYMILTSLSLAVMFHWDPMPADVRIVPAISWTGVVLLMFAGLVPSTPAKTLIAGLVAAAMAPLSMLVARARGTWPFEAASDALLMHYPDFLIVGVAVATAHVVTSLGQQVARAREMGSYELGALIGRGGMGEVYTARHRMLARPAAIKLIRPEVLGTGNQADAARAIARFRREAEAAATLRSPHTVELYDFGVTDDQTFYFVMELLDGMDLETLVRRHGPLPAGRVLHVLGQVCASLAEAHARGFVHRDIKPANIHIGRLGLACDFVKVLDFGLVKPVADASLERPLATLDGPLMGTPAYMAPEMATGAPVDARADVYAVGCVAFYLLTGRQVFDGQTVVQIIAQHLHAVPAAPSSLRAAPLPDGLDQLVAACLAKDPADRPQDAIDLARALSACHADAWTDDDARAWWASEGASPGGESESAGPVHPSMTGNSVTRLVAPAGGNGTSTTS
jgi:serine/threonine-protein kinase